VELAFASAAAAVVVVGLGVELRLLRRAPRRGEARPSVWSIGRRLRAVAVATAIVLSGGPAGEWFTDDFRGRSDDGR
jgi:hypothetical protein